MPCSAHSVRPLCCFCPPLNLPSVPCLGPLYLAVPLTGTWTCVWLSCSIPTGRPSPSRPAEITHPPLPSATPFPPPCFVFLQNICCHLMYWVLIYMMHYIYIYAFFHLDTCGRNSINICPTVREEIHPPAVLSTERRGCSKRYKDESHRPVCAF